MLAAGSVLSLSSGLGHPATAEADTANPDRSSRRAGQTFSGKAKATNGDPMSVFDVYSVGFDVPLGYRKVPARFGMCCGAGAPSSP